MVLFVLDGLEQLAGGDGTVVALCEGVHVLAVAVESLWLLKIVEIVQLLLKEVLENSAWLLRTVLIDGLLDD